MTTLLTISSSTPYYRAMRAADFQADKFPRGCHQWCFWRAVAHKCWQRGVEAENVYRAQFAATTAPSNGWAGMFL